MSNEIKETIKNLGGIVNFSSTILHTGLFEIERMIHHCNSVVYLTPRTPDSLGRATISHYKDYIIPKVCEDEINKIESYISSLDIDLLISKAHNGCTTSQYELARLYDITSYYDHKKIEKDMQKAMYWYAKSCTEENLDSIYGVAKCFICGLENPYLGMSVEKITKDDVYNINKGLKNIKLEIEKGIKIANVVDILLFLPNLGHQDAAFAIGYILSQDLLSLIRPSQPDSSLFGMLQYRLKMDKSTIKLIIKDKYEPTDTISPREMLLIERDIRRLAIYWYNEAAKRGSFVGQLTLHKWVKKS